MIDMTINIIISLFAGVIVMLVHEVSKYYFSLTLLHPIHRKRQDMKINVLKYIDPVGLIIFIFSGIGWQKPGEYNPLRFKEKEKGLLLLSIVGFLASILLMLALIPVFIYLYSTTFVGSKYLTILVYKLISFSFALIVINLLPVPPLNMAKIIYALNPNFYFKLIQNERIIQAVFILMIAFGLLNVLVQVMFEPIQMFLL